MSKQVRVWQLIAVLLVLGLAVPVMADTFSKNLKLSEPAKFGGKELKAGEYKLVFADGTATLKQGNKVVAEAKAEWFDQKQKSKIDAMVLDNGNINEIRIEGKTQAIRIL